MESAAYVLYRSPELVQKYLYTEVAQRFYFLVVSFLFGKYQNPLQTRSSTECFAGYIYVIKSRYHVVRCSARRVRGIDDLTTLQYDINNNTSINSELFQRSIASRIRNLHHERPRRRSRSCTSCSNPESSNSLSGARGTTTVAMIAAIG